MPRLLLRTRWPFIIFAVAVLLATQIMVSLNYFYQNSVQHLEHTATQAEQTLTLQHEFLQKLQNAFLAQRAFSITGYDEYRLKYEQVRPTLNTALDKIITMSSLVDQTKATAIKTELNEMIDFMNEGIARRQKDGDNLIPSPERAKVAFVHMSNLEDMISHYIQQERAYVMDAKNKQQVKQEAYNQSILLAALLSSLFLGAPGLSHVETTAKGKPDASRLEEYKRTTGFSC